MRLVAYILLGFLFISCGPAKSSNSSPGKRTLKGTWQITNIRFVGENGLYKAQLLDLADSACFNGSTCA